MAKKRILVVSEFSLLATGFSNYGYGILKRLYDSGKYEIAELGTYIKASDPRIGLVPWKVYAAVPEDHDEEGRKRYNQAYNQWGRQTHLGQFGAAVYDEVLLDFKPDYVCSWMDPWMSTVHSDSPLRPFFRWVYMPCIDSTPQRYEWLNMYESADYLLGYSDFAVNVMKEQSPKIRASGAKKLLPMPTRPGVDMSIFRPMDKAAIREKWQINKDLPIILTCMRNQQRKLFCELIDSFAKYKKENPTDETAQKSVLLLHSSGFDAGQEYWLHIARLSQNAYLPNHYEGLHKHVLHTYQCDNCNKRTIGYAIWLLHAQPSNDGSGRMYMKCPCCGAQKLRTPNTNMGYSREELAEVFNLADVYVQVSIAGACEMPISEAKACGVPVLVSANAAMAEKAQKPTTFDGKTMETKADGTPYTMHLGGIPIKIAYEFHEAATMQRRCYFDRADLAKKLTILGDKAKLAQLSKEAVESIQDNCDYDKIAEKWMYVIDNLPAKDRATTWDKKISADDIFDPSRVQIPNVDDEAFVDWCYTAILKSTVDAVGRVTWINDLRGGRSRQSIVSYFADIANKDKRADALLYRHNRQMAEREMVMAVIKDTNVLQGIMIQ